MKNFLIGLFTILTFVILIVILSYFLGWIGVHQIKTIHKARENAKREVFEQTQSYVEGKRQAALKYYKEYQQADENVKQGLKNIVAQDFANFDEDKYLTGEILMFIRNCKYH